MLSVENTLFLVVSFIFPLCRSKKTLQVGVMLGFILTADRDVVQVGVDAVKLFVLHEFHHLPLETGNTISYAKWEAGILKKLVGGFKCGIGSIFCSERNLVVSTSEVNSAKNDFELCH